MARRPAQHPPVVAAVKGEDLARASAWHRRDGQGHAVTEPLVEVMLKGRKLCHARPASALNAAHFCSAAGRRLGTCSVGQPSTGW
jgi:hypothetical protein